MYVSVCYHIHINFMKKNCGYNKLSGSGDGLITDSGETGCCAKENYWIPPPDSLFWGNSTLWA